MQRRKNTGTLRRALAVALSVIMLIGVMTIPVSAAENVRGTVRAEKVGEGVSAKVPAAPVKTPDPAETVRVSIVLDGRSTLDAGYSTMNIAANTSAMSYRDGLKREQADVQSRIEANALKGGKLDVKWNLTLAANIISANVKYGEIEAIKAVEGVKDVVLETRYEPQAVIAGGEDSPNVAVSGTMTGAQSAWLDGATGAGAKIAIIDTGIDLEHLSFDPAAFEYALGELRDENKSVDLMERSDLTAKLLRELNIYKDHGVDTIAGLYRNAKVPFGYNYIDGNYDITHMSDTQGEHGSHVAGIAAANRYVDIDGDGSYEDAIEAVGMAGNAPDAQLIVMKVFGEAGGAYDSDYLAAVEDAVILGADSVNLSLGSTAAGMVASETYEDIMESLVESDTVVVISAGNAGAWPESTAPGALYSDGVNFDTVGSPGSFTNAFTVASVDNDGLVGPTFETAGHKFALSENTTSKYTNAPVATLDKSGKGTEYPYIIFDNTGVNDDGENLLEEYAELTRGRIVMVRRGVSDFAAKHKAVEDVGGVACVVINNAPGVISMDLSGSGAEIPCVSLVMSDGEKLIASSTAGDGYYTGTLKVNGRPSAALYGSDNYTMSSFSSWGVPGDLSLKPDITAPGGNIYSVWGANTGKDEPTDAHDAYEVMSGTSMAAPQVAGISALVQRYLRDNDMSTRGLTTRALTQSLLMSTAVPMVDADGEYYPVFRQGAGLVNVAAAIDSPAYITVEGTPDGKVKAELGDDPAKDGVYTFKFTIHNLTGEKVDYVLNADVFTQEVEEGVYTGSTRPMRATVKFDSTAIAVPTGNSKYDFNGDGKFDETDAQALLDYVTSGAALKKNSGNADVNGDGKVNTWDVHVLLGNELSMEGAQDVEVTVTITLNENEKERLERENPAGAYIEAYISAVPKSTAEGVVLPALSIPVLGFYGSWSASSMFDLGDAQEWSAGEFEGGRPPYLASALEGYVTNALVAGDAYVFDGDGISENSVIQRYVASVIRNAGNAAFRVRYETPDGGVETVWSEDLGPIYATYVNNYELWEYPQQDLPFVLDWTPLGLEEGAEVEISLVLAPEYYAKYDYDWEKLTDGDESNGELGEGAFLTTRVVVDNTAPEVVTGQDKTYWKDVDGIHHILTTVKDNVGVYSVEFFKNDGESMIYRFSPEDHDINDVINFARTAPGEEKTLELEGEYALDSFYQDYYDKLIWNRRAGDLGDDVYLVQVTDTAGNYSTYRLYVNLEPTETVEELKLSQEALDLYVGSAAQLTATVLPKTLTDRGVTWSSDNEAVATVDENGVISTYRAGTATITATTKLTDASGAQLAAKCVVNVESLPLTITGVLSDANGDPMFYEWNMEEGGMRKYGELALVPDNAANAHDGTFYLFDDENFNMYLADSETGEILEGPWGWDINERKPWGMSYTEYGLDWSFRYLLKVHDNPAAPTYKGFDLLFNGMPYILGVASVVEPWEAEYEDDDGNIATASGNLVIYGIADYGSVYQFLVYDDENGPQALITKYKSDVSFDPYSVGIDNVKYSNAVVGEDGNLYFSVMTGNTNELYQLIYNEEENIYNVKLLGTFGRDVWPGFIFDVKVNGAAAGALHIPEAAELERISSVTLTPEDFERAAEMEKTDGTPAAPTGTLNSVDLPTEPVDSEDDSTGIKLDTENHTLTLPVYVSDFTNSKFTVSYNANVLDYAGIEPTGKTLVSAAVTAPGEITVGAAAAGDVDGKIAELTFTYDPASFERAPEFGMTLVEDNKTEISDPYLEIVGTVTIPAIEDDSTYDDETDLENCPSSVYTDAAKIQNEWYHEYVDYVTKKGVMKGRDDGSFDAYATLTRAELWTMLSRLDPTFTPETLPTDATWADTYQRWAMSAGVSDGTDPFRGVTRQEAVTMIYRFAKYIGVDVSAAADLTSFKDADAVADWAGDAMSWAVAKGIIEGDDTGALNPNSTALRSHIAKIVAVYMQVI